jgi:hypothetical protein
VSRSFPFTLDRDRIRLADVVLVYLERSPATPGPVPPGTVPRPYGAAPLAVGPQGVVVSPVSPGEAIWLGFQALDRHSPVVMRVRIDDPEPIDPATGDAWDDNLSENPRNYLVCPPDFSLVGRLVPGGRRMFGSDDLERFTLLLADSPADAVSVQLVAPAVFTGLTGRAPPRLDPQSAYTGRRLP